MWGKKGGNQEIKKAEANMTERGVKKLVEAYIRRKEREEGRGAQRRDVENEGKEKGLRSKTS